MSPGQKFPVVLVKFSSLFTLGLIAACSQIHADNQMVLLQIPHVELTEAAEENQFSFTSSRPHR